MIIRPYNATEGCIAIPYKLCERTRMSETGLFDVKMNRKGFGLRTEVREDVKAEYASELINAIKSAGYSKKFGRLTVHLAKEFGFCYGVDRAVELAYETCRHFPNKKIFLTTEIIHNPTVNENLRSMGVSFLSGGYQNASIADVTKNDVVIVPAFGTTVTELKTLHDIGCTLVDTICGSVVNVWKRVERYASEGYTSVIHGKYNHEETQATSSRVTMFPGSHYLIVLSDEEAVAVCDYIINGDDKNASPKENKRRRDAFLDKFKHAVSPGFDPDHHLSRIGVANQTTMLSSESMHIAHLLQQALVKRYGTAEMAERYLAFDTICSATQERQDAIVAMKDKCPDLILVVGGYNSSNTTHLQEIAMKYAASYHINSYECLLDRETLRHQIFGAKTEITTKKWLPEGDISVGITAGASTPNRVMGQVLERLIQFAE